MSSFELGLGIVRRLVQEHQATVLDYDITPERGVVNLRVTAPTPTLYGKAQWAGSRSRALLEMALELWAHGETARSGFTQMRSELVRLLAEVRDQRHALLQLRRELHEEAARYSDSSCRALELVGAGTSSLRSVALGVD